MDPGTTIVVVALLTTVILWAFRPITPFKILAAVLFIGAVWFIRQVIDFGYNPIEGKLPDVEIK